MLGGPEQNRLPTYASTRYECLVLCHLWQDITLTYRHDGYMILSSANTTRKSAVLHQIDFKDFGSFIPLVLNEFPNKFIISFPGLLESYRINFWSSSLPHFRLRQHYSCSSSTLILIWDVSYSLLTSRPVISFSSLIQAPFPIPAFRGSFCRGQKTTLVARTSLMRQNCVLLLPVCLPKGVKALSCRLPRQHSSVFLVEYILKQVLLYFPINIKNLRPSRDFADLI